MKYPATITSERRRLQKRMQVAFRRKDLELTWEVPDDWQWFLNDKATHTICKKLKTEAEIREAIAGHCPRVGCGEIQHCVHVEEAVRLYASNWGLAVFLTEGATPEQPVLIREHWHAVHEKIFCIRGSGVFHISGTRFPIRSQDVIDVPAKAIHSASLFHPTRVVTAFRTTDGLPSYMGKPENQWQ